MLKPILKPKLILKPNTEKRYFFNDTKKILDNTMNSINDIDIKDVLNTKSQDIIKTKLEFAYNIKKINDDLAKNNNTDPLKINISSNIGLLNLTLKI
ncbi:hypothetical protein Hokovirus_1_274 [Hokovirus HKV1]|uniref:Uncharacterized protein n=1 Tax=Hokovirus HKV1 TaxID=1977638 RepID=A0A1V0SFA2_9VIRU|nr:hypothetical protein Hokovirus_1_274 [Hokovirus HKV1]